MPAWLWPIHTGKVIVDQASAFHFAFWLFIGSCCAYLRWPIRWALMGCLAGALVWEVFERFAEYRWPQYWLFPEAWYNSWIGDIGVSLLAVWLAYVLVRSQC